MLRNTWIIGAAADCQLVFDVPTVSSRHCRLTRSGKGLVLEDLGSTNGTFVNDQQVWDAAPVSRGDRIGLGREVVLEADFLLDQLTAPAPASRSLWSIGQVGRKPVLAASVLLTLALLSVAVAQFSGSTAEDASAIAANTTNTTGSKEQGTLQNSPSVAAEAFGQTANIGSGNSEKQPLETPVGQVNQTPSASPPSSASAQDVAVDRRQVDPREAVYAVLVHPAQNGSTLQIGTAWAATPQRLVTSGSVVEFLNRSRAKFPTVTVKCEALGKVFSVTRFKVHPEYARLESQFQQAAKASEENGKLLDDLKRENRAPSVALENEFAASITKLEQAYKERSYFDLGLLEVEEMLPVCLPIATKSDKPKSPVMVLGGAPTDGLVDSSQLILPPGRLACLNGTKVTLARDGRSLIRWQWPTETSHESRNWTGSPLLDAAGRVIGLFSIPTPPSEPLGNPAANQFDAVSIQQLDEMLPKLFE